LSEWLLDVARVCAIDAIRITTHCLEHKREERVLFAIAGEQTTYLCLELRSIRNCRRQLRIVEVGNCCVCATGNKEHCSGRKCAAPGSSHL
jgi:predicted RNA polymerase sigma factor